MIDLKLLQKDFDTLSAKLTRKGVDITLLENLKTKNEELKAAKVEFETLQAAQNSMSKEFGIYKSQGKDISELKAKVDANKIKISEALEIQRVKQEELETIAMAVPNIPDDNVPDGADEEDNVEIKKVLTPPTFNFTPKEHWELAEQNGWINFEKGAKLAGSRFSVAYDMGAKLERALINFMLNFNSKRGYTEISVPHLVNRAALEGTGQLPKFEDDLYKVDNQDLFLIPTAEVPLTNLFQDEIIPAESLPIKMTGYTSCYRKEAGAAGRDTRGMIRQHQFHKVELVTIAKPEESDAIFEEMVQTASDVLTALELPHRIVRLCTGDLGFGAATTIDLEVWLPGQNTYREISSISNTRDFQARRAKIRYKDGTKNSFVHTLNGSSLAVGRTMVAIMENFQNEDGSITLPKALDPYLN
ncbi:MAG: serine--tRNA ligase [Epsilonproteobacteria bacterium]|nr:serine--tRNA ligase [Campylobacterota bacterium]OIO13554.1 MAG: serine--tRNA ligase [Helicobacteraceae bacterium CG1_02_36_14]PIP09770.1 MAG: serine--tRNA ligase [Sulfurimonas sp. CG23_combo_of_CG06-09_8_20_14_all_36_33]PIS23984.1 MAG: serine--tRNA ligase [Sulfurimonas sp. CG08_land_8_20_14_0_20_36_33]PIU35468.1 MAG: serine--tRNA ligase [Sulfurimonas sp. CG07_land_8_20_14_0_80_36_56]PIV05389.1 MAG: serine--tRNA ligase [Sulfurimonas sp. CG03_land_8_20_14_0_80_36_25]PIV37030.1 MAG: serine--t